MQIGTIIVTDPKAELLKDCGYSLKQKGYTIKVLNLDIKAHSNKYNPFIYIKTKTFDEVLNKEEEGEIDESDVMTLINILIANTKSEFIESVSRRSILGKSRNAIFTSIILLHY